MTKKLFKKLQKNAPIITGILILVMTFSILSINKNYSKFMGSIINVQNLSLTQTGTSNSIKYGLSNREVKQGEPVSLQVNLDNKNYIGIIVNVIGANNYVKTLYHYCHLQYINPECKNIHDQKLQGPYNINATWETKNVVSGTYTISIVAIDDKYTKTKIETDKITVTRIYLPPAPITCQNYFADMSINHPLCEEVTFLRKNGLFMGQEIRGKRYANLNSHLLRSEYFAVAQRLYDKKPGILSGNPNQILRYKDITPQILNDPQNQWWINAVIDLGTIVIGFEDGTLRPNQNLTMAELAKITALSTGFLAYYDDKKIPWYIDIVNAYRAENIYFEPRSSVRRSDAVRLIYDTMMLTGEGLYYNN